MGNSQTHETTDEKIINETTDKEKIINETTDKILVEIQTNIDNKEYKDWEVLKRKFWDAFSKINEEGKQMQMQMKMEKIAEDLLKKEIISENEFNSKKREKTESRKRKIEDSSPTKVESDLKKLKIEDGGKKRKSKKNKKSKSKSKRKNKKNLKD